METLFLNQKVARGEYSFRPQFDADGNQKLNHNSVSMFLKTGQEARQPCFLLPVSLGHIFFHTRQAGEEGTGCGKCNVR